MNIEELREIAAVYGLVLAENEEEKQEFEKLGYQKLDFELEKILPELFTAYDPTLGFYEVEKKEIIRPNKIALKYAA